MANTYEQLKSHYSDTFKDAFGFRPSTFPGEEYMKCELERLYTLIEEDIKIETINGSYYLQMAQDALAIHITNLNTPKNNPFGVLKFM